jgi:hypothetical protein
MSQYNRLLQSEKMPERSSCFEPSSIDDNGLPSVQKSARVSRSKEQFALLQLLKDDEWHNMA